MINSPPAIKMYLHCSFIIACKILEKNNFARQLNLKYTYRLSNANGSFMLISCKYSNGGVLREKALIKPSLYEYSLKVNLEWYT